MCVMSRPRQYRVKLTEQERKDLPELLRKESEKARTLTRARGALLSDAEVTPSWLRR